MKKKSEVFLPDGIGERADGFLCDHVVPESLQVACIVREKHIVILYCEVCCEFFTAPAEYLY